MNRKMRLMLVIAYSPLVIPVAATVAHAESNPTPPTSVVHPVGFPSDSCLDQRGPCFYTVG